MNSKMLSLTGNILLVFVAVMSTFGALISAFGLPVNMTILLFIWGICSAVVSLVVKHFNGRGLLIFSGVVLIIIIWYFSDVINGAKLVINIITGLFSHWISIIPFFPDASETTENSTIFVAIAGLVLISLLGYTICLRRSTINTVIITFPLIFLTFVITRLQADTLALFGIISVYLTLLIVNAVSLSDYSTGERRTLPAFAAASVIMIIAYLFAPQADYVRNEQISLLGNRLKAAVTGSQSFGGMFRPSPDTSSYEHRWLQAGENDVWQFNRNHVSVADAGRQTISSRDLLEITVSTPGIFYIRGYSMLYFNGRSWWGDDDLFISDSDRTARSMPAMLASIYTAANPDTAPETFEMQIKRTGDFTPGISYKPYYNFTLNDNRAPDIFFYMHDGVLTYMKKLEEQWPKSYIDSLMAMTESNIAGLHDRYTVINEEEADILRQMAIDAGIDIYAPRAQIADAVSRYVISSSSYTLEPTMFIPDGEHFASYFLQNFREGYCIHFTTAAVLMLRSLDIPARFVSGYVLTVLPREANELIIVTDANAHSWVEVFYEDAGWLYLEVTPPGNHSIPPPRPHTPQVESEPSQSPGQDNINAPPPDTPDPDDYENGNRENGYITSREEPSLWSALPAWVRNSIIFAVSFTLLTAVLLIRRNIVLKRRDRLFRQKNTNTAALYVWRYLGRLEMPINEEANDIKELALKARFSQHRLTLDERNKMIDFAKKLTSEIYSERTLTGKIWMKYVLGL